MLLDPVKKTYQRWLLQFINRVKENTLKNEFYQPSLLPQTNVSSTSPSI